jgi:hypothetical protein
VADEIHRIIVQASGQEELRTLQQALDASKEILRQEIELAQKLGPAFVQSSPGVRQAAEDVKRFETALKESQRSLAQSGVASGSLTQSISNLGYTINDAEQFTVSFTAGVRSVANNIGPTIAAVENLASVGFGGLIQVLSGPAGIILALTTLSTLVPVVSAHWGELENWWSGGGTANEAERMDKLAKATERTADQTDRLNKFKREQSTKEQLEKSEPQEVGQTREIIQKAVVESGFIDTAAALVKARNPQGFEGRFTDDERRRIREDEERLTSIRKPGAYIGQDVIAEAERAAAQRRAAIEEAARQRETVQAREDISKAVANPDQIGGVVNEFRRGGLDEAADRIEAGLRFRQEKEDNDLLKGIRDVEEADRKDAIKKYEEDVALMKAIREVEEYDRKQEADTIKAALEVQKEDEQAAKKKKQEAEKQEKEGVQREEEFAKGSGLDKLAQQQILAGATVAQVEAYFKQRQGFSQKAAGEIAVNADQAVYEQQVRQQLGLDGPLRRTSTITSDVQADVQRGIGGQDNERQQLAVAQEMRNFLRSIDQNTKRDFAGRIIINRKSF